jgi:hypothetical protein
MVHQSARNATYKLPGLIHFGLLTRRPRLPRKGLAQPAWRVTTEWLLLETLETDARELCSSRSRTSIDRASARRRRPNCGRRGDGARMSVPRGSHHQPNPRQPKWHEGIGNATYADPISTVSSVLPDGALARGSLRPTSLQIDRPTMEPQIIPPATCRTRPTLFRNAGRHRLGALGIRMSPNACTS